MGGAIMGDGEGMDEGKEGYRHPPPAQGPLQLFSRGCAYDDDDDDDVDDLILAALAARMRQHCDDDVVYCVAQLAFCSVRCNCCTMS